MWGPRARASGVFLLFAAALVAVSNAQCPAPAYVSPPRGVPPAPLKVAGAKLVDAITGAPVQIKAMNWFGFNNRQGSVDGLWTGGTDMATDFVQLVYQVRLLGFNAVRLPFIFGDLQNSAPDRTRGCRPSPLWQLKRHVTDPKYHPSPIPLPPPPIVVPRPSGDKQCNSYMPKTTVMDRLLWTIQIFNAHGMYVILDYHGSTGGSLEKEAIATARLFASKWTSFWKTVMCLPRFQEDFAGRVIMDILNEPDMLGLKTWGPVQSLDRSNPDWTTLALAAMDALYTASPKAALFMISGTGQTYYGLNWGNGYITDPAVLARYPQLSDPNPFFMELIRRPYVRRVIFGPHCYPPSVTMSTYLGPTLAEKLQTSFGYLQTKGYCPIPGYVAQVEGDNEEGPANSTPTPTGSSMPSGPVSSPAGDSSVTNTLKMSTAVRTGVSPIGSSATAGRTGALSGLSSGTASRVSGSRGSTGVSNVDDSGTTNGSNSTSGGGSSNGTIPDASNGGGSSSGSIGGNPDAINNSTNVSVNGTTNSTGNGTTNGGVVDNGQLGRNLPPDPDAAIAQQRGDCVLFPVILGEFGSLFEQATDIQWLMDFAAWVGAQGRAVGAPVGWAYWAYNANSGDTGGVVGSNWQTFMWSKIRFLQERMGLRPWYVG